MTDLADMGLVEAADAIMAREITSTELLEAQLKRLEADADGPATADITEDVRTATQKGAWHFQPVPLVHDQRAE